MHSGGPSGSSTCLGIDVGSTNTKAALVSVDPDGTARELGVFSSPTPDSAPELVASVRSLIRRALGTGGGPEAVGIASMAETGVPLDKDDQPLTGLLRWKDMSASREAEALIADLGAVSLFEATGVQARPKTPLCMWAALRHARPETWRNLSHWAGMADLIGLDLTGHLVTDHTLAGRTMAYRLPADASPLANAFDPDLLGTVGLRPAQLPHVARPGSAAGHVTPAAARSTGLTEGVPVVIAGHDHAVAAWAGDVREPGPVADSIGTTEAAIRVLHAPPDRTMTAHTGMSVVRTATGEREALLAGSANGGALIQWWLESASGMDRGELLRVATGIRPQDVEALVLPYRNGRQTPLPDPEAKLMVLHPDGKRADIHRMDPAMFFRALIDGLSLHLRWMVSAAQELSPAPGDQPMAVLGGSGPARRLWLDTKNAVMPMPLRVAAAREPVAAGAALLAGARLGIFPTSTGLSMETLQPAPASSAGHYNAKYRAFTRAACHTYQGDR
jgi:xylulokinase